MVSRIVMLAKGAMKANGFYRAEQALLRALLRRADARNLAKRDLLLLVDLLSSALAVVDAPPDLGEELVGR